MNFSNSSSLTTVERICAVFIPVVAIVEACILCFAGCFESIHRRKKVVDGPRDLTRLANESRFTVNGVEALYELFKTLSSSIIDDGLIHKEKFQLALFKRTVPENLFLDRVFEMFDEKQNNVIEFSEFVHALSVFHPHAPMEEKIDFAFRLYDLGKTGYIEREEVKQMVIAILKETEIKMSDEVLEAFLDQTFAEADADKDERISKEEWKAFVARNPSILKNMTLPYLMEVTTLFPSFVFNTEVEDRISSAPSKSSLLDPYQLKFKVQ